MWRQVETIWVCPWPDCMVIYGCYLFSGFGPGSAWSQYCIARHFDESCLFCYSVWPDPCVHAQGNMEWWQHLWLKRTDPCWDATLWGAWGNNFNTLASICPVGFCVYAPTSLHLTLPPTSPLYWDILPDSILWTGVLTQQAVDLPWTEGGFFLEPFIKHQAWVLYKNRLPPPSSPLGHLYA